MLYVTLLRKAVANLDMPYGIDYPFKLIKGTLLQNRFLLALHISAFGSNPQEAIRRFIRPFNMPRAFLATLATPFAEREQMPSLFAQQLIAKTAHSVPEDDLLGSMPY